MNGRLCALSARCSQPQPWNDELTGACRRLTGEERRKTAVWDDVEESREREREREGEREREREDSMGRVMKHAAQVSRL